MTTDNRQVMLDALEDADVVIILKKSGMSGVAWVKNVGVVPSKVEVMYGEADDPPLTIRQVKVNAGWPRSVWKGMDREKLHRHVDEANAA